MRFSSFLQSSSFLFFFRPEGFDVQVWCLQSFCSKLNGGSDRRFRFWIRSIFHGQNMWKTEREFGMTLVFSDLWCFFHGKKQRFQKCLQPKTISYFKATKAPQKPYRQNLTFRRLRVTKERVENGTNGFSLITFNGVGVQVWCLQSFCSKFNGGSDRRFRFGIRSNFHGQNTWKTEREFGMTLVFGDFFIKKTTLSKILVA